MPEAPGSLQLVVDLINTLDLEGPKEGLTSPRQLDAWASERNVSLGREANAEDLSVTQDFREAVRKWLLANHDDADVPTETLYQLDRLTTDVGLRPRVTAQGTVEMSPTRPGAAALIGTVLTALFEGAAASTLPRLKICPASDCQWAFYDHSRNHSRTWCSMKVCGNRNKVRTYRRRTDSA